MSNVNDDKKKEMKRQELIGEQGEKTKANAVIAVNQLREMQRYVIIAVDTRNYSGNTFE